MLTRPKKLTFLLFAYLLLFVFALFWYSNVPSVNKTNYNFTVTAEMYGTHDHFLNIADPTEYHYWNVTAEGVNKILNKCDYIMVLHIVEQLQTAALNFFQLCNLAASHKLQIMEPTIEETFYKLPDKDAVAYFSDLYNLTLANEKLKECLGINYSLIVPFDEALSLTEVVFVNLMKKREMFPEWCSNDSSRTLFVNRLEQRISNAARVDSEKHNFHIQNSDSVCIDAAGRLDVNGIFSLLTTRLTRNKGELVHGNSCCRALVFSQWRGIRTNPRKIYFYDPNFVHNNCSLLDIFQPNDQILEAAGSYISLLQLRRPYLGIHIRLEKVIQDEWTRPGWTTLCINKLLKAVRTLRDKYNLDLQNVVAFRDYGSQGSSTCQSCPTYMKSLDIDAKLASSGIRIAEYEAVDSNIPHTGKRSFAAFVEMETLSHADYLLTVGWGTFTHNVAEKFVANQGSESKVFSLCLKGYTHGRVP